MCKRHQLLCFLAGVSLLLTLGFSTSGQEVYELTAEGFEKVQAPDPGTPEGQLQAIRRLIAEKQGKQAQKRADAWIEAHPTHPLLPEAYLLRGDAKSVQEHYFHALYDYEYLARNYPASEQFQEALEREFKIAQQYGAGLKRRFWGMRIIPAYDEAEELFIRIQERAPGSKLAERSGLGLADMLYSRGHMKTAAEAYALFLENYPESVWHEHALLRLIQANLATFKGPHFDVTGLLEAQLRLQEYQNRYPAGAERIGTDALLTRIEQSMAEKLLYVGRWYEGQGKPVSAKYMYQRLIRDHPQTAAAQEALAELQALAPDLFEAPQPRVDIPARRAGSQPTEEEQTGALSPVIPQATESETPSEVEP